VENLQFNVNVRAYIGLKLLRLVNIVLKEIYTGVNTAKQNVKKNMRRNQGLEGLEKKRSALNMQNKTPEMIEKATNNLLTSFEYESRVHELMGDDNIDVIVDWLKEKNEPTKSSIPSMIRLGRKIIG
jgi:hypothetical protein